MLQPSSLPLLLLHLWVCACPVAAGTVAAAGAAALISPADALQLILQAISTAGELLGWWWWWWWGWWVGGCCWGWWCVFWGVGGVGGGMHKVRGGLVQ